LFPLELIAARRAVRRTLATETDPARRAVFEARQKSLKISTNALYGFTGTPASKLLCAALAESTLRWGRVCLQKSAEFVRDFLAHEANTVYGDTDSIMVEVLGKTPREAVVWGRGVAETISSLFPDPIELEFENVYAPFLLQHTKHYAGVSWKSEEEFVVESTPEELEKKLSIKGFECIRRDAVHLLRRLQYSVLVDLLVRKQPLSAVERVQSEIARVLSGKISLDEVITTRGSAGFLQLLLLCFSFQLYGEVQKVQITSSKMLMLNWQRESGSGSLREQFCLASAFALFFSKVRVEHASTNSVKSRCMLSSMICHVAFSFSFLTKKKKVDLQLLVQSFIVKPFQRIFCLPNIFDAACHAQGFRKADDVFRGRHMLISSKKSKAKPAGTMGAFFVKVSTRCVACGNVMKQPPTPKASRGKRGYEAQFEECKESSFPVCASCQKSPGLAVVIRNKSMDVNFAQRLETSLQSQCFSCQARCSGADSQGGILGEFRCENQDCFVFWRRQKANQNVQAAQQTLSLFDW
jgi:hypothetical protein